MFRKTPPSVLSFPFICALHMIVVSNLEPYYHYKLLLLIPLVIFFWLFKVSPKYIFLSLVASSVLVVVTRLLDPYQIRGTYLSKLFNPLFHMHEWVVDWVRSSYSKDVHEIINLLVFNHKSTHIYSDFVNLGIPHLIAISGMHFSVLSKSIRAFIKNPNVAFGILLLYWYAIDFSIPGLRVLLFILIPSKGDEVRRWGIVTLVSLLFNVHMYRSLPFLLSYGLSLVFSITRTFYRDVDRANGINCILAFIISTIASLPLRPHRIYPLSIMNSMIFYPIIILLFIYFFFTWPFAFLSFLHEFMASVFGMFNRSLSLNQLSISVDYWDYSYSLFCLVFLISFFVVFIHYLCIRFPSVCKSG